MAETALRPYRGVPADERVAARRAQLLEAALDLLGSDGAPGTTVRAVCRRAQLTPRFFYESFADLDDLLVAVFDTIVEDATAAMLAALAATDSDAGPEVRAHVAIAAFVHALTDDPRRARVACVAALGSEPLARRRLEAMRGAAALVAEQARATYRSTPDAEPLVQLTSHVLVGGLAELLIAWLDGAIELEGREQLIDDYVAVFVATGEGAARVAASRAARRPRRTAGTTARTARGRSPR